MQGAKYDWFGRGRAHDARYLDEWRSVPLSYTLGQTVDSSFHRDHHEQFVTDNCTPAIFARAADWLLRYHFYPESLMRHVSDFSRENRRMRPGDRILQRINGLALLGLPFSIVDGLTMNEVVSVVDEPRRKAFTYVTTEAHAEMGEWSAGIEWRADNRLLVTIDSCSRPAYPVPALFYGFMRRGQLRAHHLGLENFYMKIRHVHKQ